MYHLIYYLGFMINILCHFLHIDTMPWMQKIVQDILEDEAADLQLYILAVQWVKST